MQRPRQHCATKIEFLEQRVCLSSIAGNWTGTMTENASSVPSNYSLYIRLAQSGNNVTGTELIQPLNFFSNPSAYYGSISLHGSVSGSVFIFQEDAVTDENEPVGYSWLIKSGALQISSDGLSMAGPWNSEGYTGSVALARTSDIVGTFVDANMLHHVFPQYSFTAPITITDESLSAFTQKLTIDYYLSTDQEIDVSSTLLHKVSARVTNLEPQQSQVLESSKNAPKLVISAKQPLGTYYLFARIVAGSGSTLQSTDIAGPTLIVFKGFGSSPHVGDTAAHRAKNYVSAAEAAKSDPVALLNNFNDGSAEAFIENNEGAVPYTYLDTSTPRIPTIGPGLALQDVVNGKLVDSPYAEQLISQLSLPYTFDEIVRQAYTPQHEAILTSADINDLFASAYATATADAISAVSDFYQLSANAQIATIDMSYNLGLGKFEQFTTMIADLDKDDFVSAAIESMDSLRSIEVFPRVEADFEQFVAGYESDI
jgi:hypothetical protein